jgi:hypothetical protein
MTTRAAYPERTKADRNLRDGIAVSIDAPVRPQTACPRTARPQTGRRWATEIPVRDDARERSRFPVTDYADNFEAEAGPAARGADQYAADQRSTGQHGADQGGAEQRSAEQRSAEQRSAEQWARAMFEGAPVGLRTFLVRTWPLLGVRLGPLHSAGYVLGWRILKSTPDFVVLQARSGAGVTIRLVVQTDGRSVLAGTFVRCQGLPGRALWFAIAPIHRLVVSRLLGEATR